MAAAKHAFEKGEWSKYQHPDRRNVTIKFADLIEKNMDELAHIESTDNGKSVNNAILDIKKAVEITRYYAGWAEKIHGQ